MLSVSLIERTLETRDYDRILRDLADNGMEIPLSLRLRLGQSPVAPMALALRRLVELTYGPTQLSRQLVDRLLVSQGPEGGFAADSEHDRDPLVTAAVLAGLERVAADHPATADDELLAALDRGYAALAELQDCDGLFSSPSDRSLADRAMTSAFILSLLGSEARFRGAVRMSELFRWFDIHEGRLDRHTQHLWDLASITSSHTEVEPLVFAA
ncbi:hypothetical protein [Algisphaera agarilytica]|uniref:Uncharacterized protein n=1 Tax=Algisphaera agarilytica TaxID=1385975 RepID=A0A7X0LM70_9BACT|nr:hypothetical protein [Algisphaera agarilytica]MBB6430713.1 hypothetical protein [Algisphaera agarilytica]